MSNAEGLNANLGMVSNQAILFSFVFNSSAVLEKIFQLSLGWFTINCVAFSIANSPLVKTAIAGEDPNWGRIIMAIGKANVDLNLSKLGINFGEIKVIEKGQLFLNYEEAEVAEYMRGEKIDLTIDLSIGNKKFTAYTMDLTKKYIEINADYRSWSILALYK